MCFPCWHFSKYSHGTFCNPILGPPKWLFVIITAHYPYSVGKNPMCIPCVLLHKLMPQTFPNSFYSNSQGYKQNNLSAHLSLFSLIKLPQPHFFNTEKEKMLLGYWTCAKPDTEWARTNKKLRVWSRERVIAEPCKKNGRLSPLKVRTPQSISAKFFKSQVKKRD